MTREEILERYDQRKDSISEILRESGMTRYELMQILTAHGARERKIKSQEVKEEAELRRLERQKMYSSNWAKYDDEGNEIDA